MKSLTKIHDIVTQLPRGGYLLDSEEGYIQFGSPPETIKDTMALPKSVPQIFVLPQQLFHRQKGISIAELEFPIYFNYFIKKRKTKIICSKEQSLRLLEILREAVFGPEDVSLKDDVQSHYSDIILPDLRKELDFYRGNTTFDDLLEFGYFKKDIYKIGNVAIKIDLKHNYDVFFGKKMVAQIPGIIEYKPKYIVGQRLPEPYKPPLFGVTCLGPSHGFDPTENTSGYIIWLNHNGIMIDPPVNSTEWLKDSNVNPKLIGSIILTHCHADHDAGAFQKILEEGKITLYTTKTVLDSFLKKYSSLSGEPISYLKKLFNFHRIYLGQPVFIHGGECNIFYTLHSIPTIGFTLKFQDQTFVYSSDHQADPAVQKELLAKGIISKERYKQLQNFPWDSKVIYHESGIAPLHTPIKYLNSLPKNIQKKTVVYHIAKKDFPEETDLTLATFGIEKTLYFKTKPPVYEKMYEMIGVLKHLDFFDTLSVTKVQEFVSIINEEKYKKGSSVIEKGKKGSKFFIISSGNVTIVNDELVDKKVLGTYEYFGEVALLTEQPRTVDVIAETDVIVYTIEKNKFLSFISGTDFEKTLRRLIKNRNRGVWNILSVSKFSKYLSSYQKTWIESILVQEKYEKSGTIIREGEVLKRIYIISKGKVNVSKKGKKIAVLDKGDFIGAMSRIHRGEAAEFTFTYNKPVTLLYISKKDAIEFLKRNPGLGMKFSYSFSTII